MIENKKYEKGSLGWLREKANRDGFYNIKDWQSWKTNNVDQLKNKVRNIKQISAFEKKGFNDKERENFYRFWGHVDIKDNIEECWNWTGCTNKGYGIFRCGTNTTYAHRFACSMKERIPHGFQVQHLCNNPMCCNPNHLKPGTCLVNTEYMIKCNRQPKGESSGVAILTEDQVIEIHRLYREGISRYTKQWQIIEPIAKKFGTTKRNINAIINGERWSHIYNEFK